MATTSVPRLILYTNHMCPFCQRVEFLLHAKGLWDKVDVRFIDLATPRPAWFLEKTGGTTSVPVLELPDGSILKESLVLVRYIEDIAAGHAPTDAYRRGILNMWIALEDGFTTAGYRFLLNTDETKRTALAEAYVAQAKKLDAFLRRYAPDSTFLFANYGVAEAVYAPFFLRFTPLLSHYELWDLPHEGLERFLKYHNAAVALLARPELGQITPDDVIKAYYDYAIGTGNSRLPEGRSKSTFIAEPKYRVRPLPPKDKWHSEKQTDAQLGLLA